MPSFSWSFRGVDRVRNSLRQMVARAPQIVDETMGEWAKETRADLKGTRYPAPPLPKKGRKPYRRTGRLANSWFAKRIKIGQWAIGNRAQAKGRGYASYVIGDESGKHGKQAWMHKRRWWKATEEIKRRIGKLRRRINDALDRELRRNGL
jgi:hypothetical protein